MPTIDQSELRDRHRKIAEHFHSGGNSLDDSIVRLDSLVEAAQKIDQGQSLLVLGHMGIGKTSFIKSLKARFGEERSLLIESLPFNDDKEQLIKEIGIYEVACFIGKTEIANSRSGIRLKSEKKLAGEWYRKIQDSGESALAYLDDYAAKRNLTTPIIVALDYERGLEAHPETFKAVTELSRLPNLVFAMSLHARPRLSRFIDDNTDGFERFYVPMLDREEIEHLIKTQLEGTGVGFDDSAIDAINRITGGRPFEIQLIAHGLVSPGLKRFTPKVVYTEADVNDLYQDKKFQEWELQPAETCLKGAYEDFTPSQKELIGVIVRDGKATLDSSVEQIADELLSTGIFRVSEDGFQLLIRGEFAQSCFAVIAADPYC